jgi:hypothetical protein
MAAIDLYVLRMDVILGARPPLSFTLSLSPCPRLDPHLGSPALRAHQLGVGVIPVPRHTLLVQEEERQLARTRREWERDHGLDS